MYLGWSIHWWKPWKELFHAIPVLGVSRVMGLFGIEHKRFGPWVFVRVGYNGEWLRAQLARKLGFNQLTYDRKRAIYGYAADGVGSSDWRIAYGGPRNRFRVERRINGQWLPLRFPDTGEPYEYDTFSEAQAHYMEAV